MEHRVVKKQPNSKLCLVCGLKNALGLKAEFYELENGDLCAIFLPCEEHQSYPGRMHGGIAAAILDETIGRAVLGEMGKEIWGVTLELTTNFRKPVPLDQPLKVFGRITRDRGRIFEGSGELVLPSGEVAVTATGRFMKLPLDKIADFDAEANEWRVVDRSDDPQTIIGA